MAKRLASARPQVAGPLPETVWIKLGFAFRVAREKIRTIPGCAGLFTSRGADGLELLRSVTFAKATRARDLPPCERTAFALIEVGGRRIRLCSRFNELSAPAAAVILIHETLHAAGMSEKPPDPNALTGGEINRLVKNRCGD